MLCSTWHIFSLSMYFQNTNMLYKTQLTWHFKLALIYVAPTLLIEGVSRYPTCLSVMTSTNVITLNYVIFSKFYQCRHVNVGVFWVLYTLTLITRVSSFTLFVEIVTQNWWFNEILEIGYNANQMSELLGNIDAKGWVSLDTDGKKLVNE
jgi:hypothetical protein